MRAHALHLRMPCHPGTGPITGHWTFEYPFEGVDRYGFKGLTFPQLLAATKGIRQQRRPRWHNLVGEVGSSDPARRPLLEWLEDVEFDLPPELLDSVHGDQARVAIPCIRLNLTPKE
jgi:hypothetical protein